MPTGRTFPKPFLSSLIHDICNAMRFYWYKPWWFTVEQKALSQSLPSRRSAAGSISSISSHDTRLEGLIVGQRSQRGKNQDCAGDPVHAQRNKLWIQVYSMSSPAPLLEAQDSSIISSFLRLGTFPQAL